MRICRVTVSRRDGALVLFSSCGHPAEFCIWHLRSSVKSWVCEEHRDLHVGRGSALNLPLTLPSTTDPGPSLDS